MTHHTLVLYVAKTMTIFTACEHTHTRTHARTHTHTTLHKHELHMDYTHRQTTHIYTHYTNTHVCAHTHTGAHTRV